MSQIELLPMNLVESIFTYSCLYMFIYLLYNFYNHYSLVVLCLIALFKIIKWSLKLSKPQYMKEKEARIFNSAQENRNIFNDYRIQFFSFLPYEIPLLNSRKGRLAY